MKRNAQIQAAMDLREEYLERRMRLREKGGFMEGSPRTAASELFYAKSNLECAQGDILLLQTIVKALGQNVSVQIWPEVVVEGVLYLPTRPGYFRSKVEMGSYNDGSEKRVPGKSKGRRKKDRQGEEGESLFDERAGGGEGDRDVAQREEEGAQEGG